jgi:hypothetical protein
VKECAKRILSHNTIYPLRGGAARTPGTFDISLRSLASQ